MVALYFVFYLLLFLHQLILVSIEINACWSCEIFDICLMDKQIGKDFGCIRLTLSLQLSEDCSIA